MHSRGFTLVEVLVVMTISAILLAMAMPSMQSMIQSNRISGAANTILAAFDLSRSEAVRRASAVTVCRSVDATAPAPSCSSGAFGNFADNDWASGWIAFAKAPGNANNAAVEPNDEILLRQGPLQLPATQRLIIESSLANDQRRSFDARGLTIGGGQFGITLFVDHRDPQVAVRTNMARCIALNVSGRARVARVVNDACPQA